MKKFFYELCGFHVRMKKILLAMKLTVIAFFLGLISLSASTYSQNTKLTLDLEGVTLFDVFKQIESQSEFVFIYKSATVDLNRKVNVKVEETTVDKILENVLRDSGIRFEINTKQIILTPDRAIPANNDKKKINEEMQPLQKTGISGIVKDSKGIPLSGVTVLVKGTTNGVITDPEGHYSLINVPKDAILVFTFIGMKNQEIKIGENKILNVTMEETVFEMSEVVAVGYGTQKKVNLTGAVSSITSDKLSIVPTANVSTLLYGNLPGLIPIQRSGQPGLDDVSLSIRGFSNALVVVDGIVGRDFSRLDPNEIESFTILKDAASSAVYGVSGGNGVILVTTKKGKIGKPTFNYTMNYGVQQMTKFPSQVNSEEYAILMNESAINVGGKPIYTQEEIQKFREGTDPKYPNFDYYDYMLRDYPSQMQQNFSVRGGSEKIKYFFLLGQMSQATMWKSKGGGNQDYAKYNFRSNVDASIGDNLDISVGFSGRVEDRDNLINDAYTMTAWLQYQSPIYNPKTPDGKIQSTNYGLTGDLDRNLAGYIKNQINVYEGTLSLNYKIPFIKGLSINFKASRDMSFQDAKQWTGKYSLYKWDEATQTSTQTSSRGSSQLILNTAKSSASRIQSSLNYERTFAVVHNVKALLLHEVSENRATNFMASRRDYVLPIDQIFAGPDLNKSNGGGASDNGRESYVGRVNYDYSGKYLFEYSFRYDGSAKFPPDKRWGYFPGISAGWRISEESFIKDNFNAIDNLKLRGSWGKLGSDNTGNFQFLTGYTYPSGNYVLGGSTVTAGMNATATPNPNITWERSQIFDLGVDLSLWQRLLEIEGDVFYRKREGLLATRTGQLPTTFGAALPSENLNSDDARGFEVLLGHSSKIGEIKYRLSTNLSYSRLKYRHLEQRTFNNQYDNWRNNLADRWNDLFWGYKAIGQFQSMEEIYSSPIQDLKQNSTLRPGDIKYDDFNKDGIINSMDAQIIGRGGTPKTWVEFESTPRLNYGLGINANWKRITVDMNWQGASMANFLEAYDMIAPFKDGRSAFSYFLDRWHREDPSDPYSAWIPGKYPATIVNGAANNLLTSSFWMKDKTYIRLKSLNISYNLESQFLKRNGIQGLVVSLSGQNLLTFSGLGPVDPETNSSLLSYYPQQKTYNIGINITF